MTTLWYYVRDLAAARTFYTSKLGFSETWVDEARTWAKLERAGIEIGLSEGEPDKDGAVAHVDVDDVRSVADEFRAAGVDVGVVFELHGQMRLVDVLDLDGNRLQFAEEVS